MITEAIINVLFVLANGFTSLFPAISWNVDSAVFNTFFDIIKIAAYLLPMYTVIAILEIVIAFQVFKIVIALTKTIWDLIPLL